MNLKGYSVLIMVLIFFLYFWGLFNIFELPVEPFVSGTCQTTLIKDGNYIFLYDPSMAKVPGVNPIKFKDLDEYKEYIEWQRKSNLRCPILHLEKTCTAQGTHMYEIRQNFLDIPEHGSQLKQVSRILPFDPENQTQGIPDSDALSLALT